MLRSRRNDPRGLAGDIENFPYQAMTFRLPACVGRLLAGLLACAAAPAMAAPIAVITAPPGASPTVTAAVAYINGLLASGTTPLALSTALQSAAATSAAIADPAAIAQLSPQAYASASQIGIENGLALAVTLRGHTFAPAAADGRRLFSFAEGFGGRRELPGSAAIGTNRANIGSAGAIGGIGFGSTAASVALFVGYVDARQTIGAIGARTTDHGIVAGAVAQATISGIDIQALIAWDGSSATTRRTLTNGTQAKGHYRMRGWTIDASASYGFEFQHGWWVHPRIGATYISSKRGATSESGAGAFDLNVAADRTDAGFVDGAIRFETESGPAIRPWISAGVRYQFKGRTSIAASSFTGTTATLSVPGVARDRTTAILAGGLSATVSRNLNLFARIDGEFGSGTTSENGNAGISYRF